MYADVHCGKIQKPTFESGTSVFESDEISVMALKVSATDGVKVCLYFRNVSNNSCMGEFSIWNSVHFSVFQGELFPGLVNSHCELLASFPCIHASTRYLDDEIIY